MIQLYGFPGGPEEKETACNAMQETWVGSLGWEDLEKGMATHSSILVYKYTYLFVDTYIYYLSYSLPLEFVCLGIEYSSGH